MIPRVLIRGPITTEDDRSPRATPDSDALHRVALDSRQLHYLTRVLRLGDGAAVQAFDGQGRRWSAALCLERNTAWLALGAQVAATPESPLAIRIGQCLSGADKMDWTIEKAVELGAHAISPLFSQRSQIRIDEARAHRKLEHWRAVAESACIQSGRDRVPAIDPAEPLDRWLARVTEPVKLALDPSAGMMLSAWARQTGTLAGPVCLLVGPESGLAETELGAARDAGFVMVGLGARVLRTETAGLAAIAALQALAGDF